jgi:phosphoglycerate dehydrogenase-like enzyme
MKIIMIGEAAEHEDDLRRGLARPHEIVALPTDAAGSAADDGLIATDDVVVSLRWSRPAGERPSFRLLHVPGAGLDGLDLAALRPVTAVANVYEHEIPIAEFVLARLLEWEIRAAAMQASFGPATWADAYRHRVPHGELHGTTLAIVGYGRIGRAIAARATAFGVCVRPIDAAERLSEVVAQCDYVVLACPLTPATRGLVDAALLGRMQAHAVLVNVSRAEIVDEAALYTALCDNAIGGAILDVWYRYPTSAEDGCAPAAHPFWELPNAWCTPHSSAWTHQLSRRRYAVVADNVNRLVAGRPLRNLVRP